ncbi:multidrug resistance-associated protein 4-like [Centruroides sculpturatus]|uniref:multidrug resistance-associated protein 4-like n=1 Tax=Centruroides sculpturatus TaxID=218467 RepID=UPI000C6EB91B|nr:multidrug resistance-associated protein 4-like [Centruroides sculpturatus]
MFTALVKSWVFPIINKGRKQILKEEDLHEASQHHTSEYLGDLLQKEWKKELQKKNPNILKTVLSFVGWKYLVVILLVLIQETALVAGQAYFLGSTVRYFENREEWNYYNVYLTIAGFFTVTAIYLFTHNTNLFMTEYYSMKLKVAFCTLIYRKAIRLSSSSLEKSNVGQMVNLLANDVGKFQNKVFSISSLFTSPFFIIFSILMLWQYYGWTILMGYLVVFLFVPIQFALSKLYSKLRLQAAILADERLNLLNEMIADMRLIKMYTWELPYAALIEKIRLYGISYILAYPISKLFILLSFVAILLNGGELNSKIAFVTMLYSLYVFNSIFTLFSHGMSFFAEILVSLKRIQGFLLLHEKENNAVKTVEKEDNLKEILMDTVTAAWKKGTEPTLNGISLNMQSGELLLVVGHVGSGKTSLLMSVLGEIPITSGEVSVKGKISYASQEAWVFNATVRENILFGEEYHEDKYKKVLHITALEKDIRLFPKGDQTIVGERGVIMSGGQKARINLARALYVDAVIFLLDDPLSAVDVPVAKHIFEKCIMEYLKDKICILVTHQIQFLNSASKILVLKKEVENNKIPRDNERVKKPKISVYKAYVNAGAGLFFKIVILSTLIISLSVTSASDYWLIEWLQDIRIYSQNEENLENMTSNRSFFNEFKNNNFYYNEFFDMYVYIGLICAVFLTSIPSGLLLYKFFTIASFKLHNNMFRCIIRTPIAFLDNNPVGKILNRFSKDVSTMDDLIPFFTYYLIRGYLILVGMCVVQAIVCPYLLVLIAVLSIIFYAFWTIFSRVMKSIKHLEGKFRRAFLYCGNIMDRDKEIDRIKRIAESLGYRRNIIAGIVRNFEIKDTKVSKQRPSKYIKFTYNKNVRSVMKEIADIKESTVILKRAPNLFKILRNDKGDIKKEDKAGVYKIPYENQQLGLKKEYIGVTTRKLGNLKSEASYESLPHQRPPSDWPERGEIHFDNVSLQYSTDKNIVLKNLTFHIRTGEKIGIVGRTGAGKSSIIAALFRMTEPTGTITIDGVDIKDIGLRDLRSKISIIPQDPMLFTGPLRRNMDPFNEYSEEMLWKAIEQVQLKEVISKLPGGLDSHLTEGGRNFSVGERQLICLARTILRQNKILVMDEATSNIDKRTDSCLQKIIREKFKSCTVLTIAHRLHTIIDSDRVLVLDTGRVQDFDSPYALLKNVNGIFYNLVKKTGVTSMNELYEIAKVKYYDKERVEQTKL